MTGPITKNPSSLLECVPSMISIHKYKIETVDRGSFMKSLQPINSLTSPDCPQYHTILLST